MSHAPCPRLVGVGVGPGDPELVTLKAVRILREADLVICPDASLGRAEAIVTAVVPNATIRRVTFSMSRQIAQRQESRAAAAAAVTEAFTAGATMVAFATVGDPNVYSTFSYIAAALDPGVAVETVPGITAMQLLSSEAGDPLTLGDEILALAPATAGAARLARIAEAADSVVVYKAGRTLAATSQPLTDAGFDLVVGSDLGTSRQRLHWGVPDALDGYFTSLFGRRPQ